MCKIKKKKQERNLLVIHTMKVLILFSYDMLRDRR